MTYDFDFKQFGYNSQTYTIFRENSNLSGYFSIENRLFKNVFAHTLHFFFYSSTDFQNFAAHITTKLVPVIVKKMFCVPPN